MIKNLFLVFHSLTLVSSILACVYFLTFFLRSNESVNLLVLIPALIVAGILVLNSHFMFQGQYQTGYFTAMRFVTILGGSFSVFALFVVASAFSRSSGSPWNEVIQTLMRTPLLIIKDPLQSLLFLFPIFAAATAITSYFFERSK